MRAPGIMGRVRTLSSVWRQTPVMARICLSIWVGIGILGLGRMATTAQAAFHAAAIGGYQKRTEIWTPIYGFAATCAPRLIPGASILLVDPADQLPFTAGYKPPDLWSVDTGNLTIYTYALYPHPVSPLGDVPSNWAPASEPVDYIALWEQTILRSPGRQAMAHDAEQTLRQTLPGRLVCTYAGARGEHGFVFARSDRAFSALTQAQVRDPNAANASGAPQVGARVSVNVVVTFALVLLGLAALWLIGAVILVSTLGRTLAIRMVAALALPLGCVGIAFEMLLYSIAGIRWSIGALIIPWLALGGVILWRHRAALTISQLRRSRAAVQRRRLAPDERVALVALVVVAGGACVLAPAQVPFFDGLFFYYFRAKLFFSDLSMTPYYQHASTLSFTVPAHPPLVALCVTWLYLFTGKVDEQPTLLLWPALFIALLAVFYLLARSKASRRMSLWLTLGLALVSAITPESVTAPYPAHVFSTLLTSAMVGGYADLPLAVLLFCGCGLLWYWASSEQKSRRVLIVAGCFLGGAALTKEEGMTAMLFALAASPLLIVWTVGHLREALPTGRTPWWRALIWSGTAGVVVLLPWLYMRFAYPMADFPLATAGRSPGQVFERLVLVTIYFAARLVAFAPAPLILLGAWVIERRMRHAPLSFKTSGRWLFLACVVVAQLAADALVEVGVSSTPGEALGLVASNNARLILQVTPLMFLAAVALWSDIMTRPGAAHAHASRRASYSHLEPASVQ